MKKDTRGIGNLFTNGDTERHSILDHFSDIVCQFSIDGELNYVNRAFCELFQKTSQELLGANYFDLVSIERSANLRDSCKKITPGQPQSYLEFIGEAPGGGHVWRHWVDQGIFDHNVELVEILATGRLIDGQALLGFAAERYALGIGALTTATTALQTTLNLETLLNKILDAAIDAIPKAEQGMLYLISADTGQLQMQDLLGFTGTDPRIKKSLPDGSSYLAQVVRIRSPIRLDEIVEKDPNPTGHPKPSQRQSAIVAPLLYQDHLLGVLSLEASRPAAFTNIDLDLLTNFANTVTGALRCAKLQAQIQKLAQTDELTGLFNRRGFYKLGEREIQRAIRYKRPLAILLLDIDHFKQHNETFGHDIGDQILSYFGKIARTSTRNVDICGRYGGDEIVILLPETDLFAAAGVAQRLRNHYCENPFQIDNKPLKFTVSIGVTKLTSKITNLENLIKRADIALNTAKENGRNCVEIR